MSQNAHTLQLFFQDPIQLKYCQLTYQYLVADQTDQASRWASKLGIADVAAIWDAEWFNQEVSAQPGHLRLRFDTGPHDALPLLALETLFAHGMQSAVLEVFYDQVGEVERLHFSNGQWVSRQTFFAQNPTLLPLVEPTDGGDDGAHANAKDPGKPIAISTMRVQEAQRKEQAQENVKALLEVAKASRELGGFKGLVAVLVLRAGLKGLLQAAAFTAVTVLLFKGLWLWLGLGLVLAIVLPLYYMNATAGELKAGNDSDDDTLSANP
ncbi:MAG: hypothetical protein V4627_07160 [Pseudomonadota bacterium]